MTYEEITALAVNVMVERNAVSVADDDTSLDRFAVAAGSRWVSGRAALTAGQVTFTAQRVQRGASLLDVRIAQVRSVETGGRHMPNVAVIRTRSHTITLRGFGAVGFAQCVADVADGRALVTA